MPVVKVTDENFKSEVLESPSPVVVDFGATWCGPCKLLAPLFEELSDDYKDKSIKFVKVDVEEAAQTATEFAVTSVPMLVFFKNGSQVDQMVGLQPLDKITEKIEACIG